MKTKHVSSLEGFFYHQNHAKKLFINTLHIQKMYKGIRKKKTSFIAKRGSVLT
jgi:hypothetical protein